MEYFYAQWLTVWGPWSIFSQVCRPLSWPACPAALNREGSAIGTDGNSFSHVVQRKRKRKALVKQTSTRATAETSSDEFNCTGLCLAAADRSNIPNTYFPFITSINLAPPHTTSSDHWKIHRDLVAVKEEAPQAVLTDVVGVRSSKGEILRAGVPIVCGEENNRNDESSRNEVFYVQHYAF